MVLLVTMSTTGCFLVGRTMKERTKLAPQYMAEESIDMAIDATVKLSLTSDPEIALQMKNITVKVENRVVTLEGEIETEDQKKRAERLARGVAKVRDVINRMKVSGKHEATGLFDD
jgi:osmotically-inducible protein OsmY